MENDILDALEDIGWVKMVEIWDNFDWLRAGRWRGRSSSPGEVKNFSSRRPNRFWDPPSLLSDGYRGRGVKLTTNLKLVPKLRKRGSVHPLRS
jgi:hypothetical protein